MSRIIFLSVLFLGGCGAIDDPAGDPTGGTTGSGSTSGGSGTTTGGGTSGGSGTTTGSSTPKFAGTYSVTYSLQSDTCMLYGFPCDSGSTETWALTNTTLTVGGNVLPLYLWNGKYGLDLSSSVALGNGCYINKGATLLFAQAASGELVIGYSASMDYPACNGYAAWSCLCGYRASGSKVN